MRNRVHKAKLSNFHHFRLTSPFSDPNIFLTVLFLNTPTLHVEEQVSYLHKTRSKIIIV